MNNNTLDLSDAQHNNFNVVNNSMPVFGMENNITYSITYHTAGINHRSEDAPSPTDNLTGIIFCIFFLVLCLFCTKPNIPDARFRRGHEIRARALRQQALREVKEKFTKDPEERPKLIEYSLMKKKVIAIDVENENLELGDIDDTDEEQQEQEVGSTASSNFEDEDNTCIICLDTFRVGDRVAWSRFTPSKCLHVFHQECIEEWLQANHDCPTCRTIILQESAKEKTVCNNQETQEQQREEEKTQEQQQQRGEETREQQIKAEDLSRQRHRHHDDSNDNSEVGNEHGQNSVFLIMHGLISRVANKAGGNYSLIGQTIESMDEDREEFQNNPNDDDNIC